ncbi:MAG: hypothetical protein KF862_11340 [Chitinophagaceae bacterium]|nr:hypothetical protein [Chitinophagaceae bacterium]
MFRYLHQQNSRRTLQIIEKGYYTDDELILVKVPVLLPYATNWNEYERYDGEIEWGGVHYNYVKRKVLNDTLYLLCLPDIERTRLTNAHNRYAGKMNDLSSSSQKGKEIVVKITVSSTDYIQSRDMYNLQEPEITARSKYYDVSTSLIHTFSDCIIQPPDTAAI